MTNQTSMSASAIVEKTIADDVAQFHRAADGGAYSYTEEDIRGFFEGGWDAAFEADCARIGILPDELIDAVIDELL
jgi:hypothetical protein